jgi:hypothetical protein
MLPDAKVIGEFVCHRFHSTLKNVQVKRGLVSPFMRNTFFTRAPGLW